MLIFVVCGRKSEMLCFTDKLNQNIFCFRKMSKRAKIHDESGTTQNTPLWGLYYQENYCVIYQFH